MTDPEQQPQDNNIPLPFTTEPVAEVPIQSENLPPQWTISKLSDLFLKGLPAIAGLTAIFAVLGYVIVNLSLGFYTDIQPFSVVLNQYIATGIAVFILMSMIVVPAWFFSRRPSRLSRIGLSLIMALSEAFPLHVVFSIYNRGSRDLENILLEVGMWTIIFVFFIASGSELINMATNNRDLVTKLFAGTLGTLFIVLYILGIVAIYPILPRSLGGGYIGKVKLIFEGADLARSLNLPMVSDKETDEICLLAELTDGYLIYDPSQTQAFVIKYDLVVAIRDTWEPLDCSAPFFSSSTLPTATP